jgi:hypothetical protein
MYICVHFGFRTGNSEVLGHPQWSINDSFHSY